jgi:hypothetical protein
LLKFFFPSQTFFLLCPYEQVSKQVEKRKTATLESSWFFESENDFFLSMMIVDGFSYEEKGSLEFFHRP